MVQEFRAVTDWRTYLGRSLNLDHIESVLQMSWVGYMLPMADLIDESMFLHGHWLSCAQKRVNRIEALPMEVVPATGEDVNEDLAQELADVVRGQIKQIDMKARTKDLAWGLSDGRSCLELEWTQRSSRSYPLVDLHWVHPRRLSFGPCRDLRVISSWSDVGNFVDSGIAVDEVPNKFCSFLPRIFNDYPEREGLGPRSLYWSFFGRFGTRERLILMELFGKPWRIIELDPEVNHLTEALEEAEEIIDGLGGSSTARVPPGVSVKVVSPADGAGEVHKDVIQQANDEISKLWLGTTATADPKPSGLASNTTEQLADEQWLITAGDASMLSACLTKGIARAIVDVNYGRAALDHCPAIMIRAEKPPEAKTELENAEKALRLGMRLSLEEMYHRTGYRRPGDDEIAIELVSDSTGALGGGAPLARIIYPAGEAPEAGVLAPVPAVERPEGDGPGGEGGAGGGRDLLTPSDAAKVVTVNEARASMDPPLPPLALPDGSPDPDGDLIVAEFEAKRAAAGEATGTAEGKVAAREIDPTPEPKPPQMQPGFPPSGGLNQQQNQSVTETDAALTNRTGMVNLFEFNDDQPRAENGEWAPAGGGSSGGSHETVHSEKHGEGRVRTQADLVASVPKDTKGRQTYEGFPVSGINKVHEFSGDTGLKAVIYRKDRNGKEVQTYKYTDAHQQQHADAKFARADRMAQGIKDLRTRAEHDSHSTDAKTRDAAVAVRLVDHTTMRIGGGKSEKDTGSVGATTLRAEHVHPQPDGSVRVIFPGKSGKQWDREVTGPLAHELRARTEGKDPSARVFNVSAQDVNGYLGKASAAAKITAKDFRTFHGTAVADKILSAMPAPRTMTEANKNIAAAIKETSEHLGNTPAICKAKYVNPRVLDAYRNQVAARKAS